MRLGKSIVLIAAINICSWTGITAAAAEDLSYKDLVLRLIDLERLAVLPEPGETGAMWSSYDRQSRYDEKTGKYVAWGANRDGNGIIRAEDEQIVMAEMEGPGCIWRIWSANAAAGHVKIYLDGKSEPAVDLKFGEYFNNATPPFNYSSLSYNNASSGKNLYFPIPYRKSCRIVADKAWGQYYHFTYTTFPKGTTVPTFTTELPPEDVEALKDLDGFLRNRLGTDPAGERKGQKNIKKTVTVKAGESATLAKLAGPRAITAIKVKNNFADRYDAMIPLRNMVLRITWDDQKEPAVWCPLGDFFGSAPTFNYYKSLVLGMTEDHFYSYWYMPFGKSALVELVNDGETPYELEFTITHAPLTRDFEKLGYFHAKWHRDTTPVSQDRRPDWTVLKTEGRGRFCGMMLHVWNQQGGWWGEGDEKFFVDSETMPSTFGTGSEDYFGYAWCNPTLFQKSFHGQTMTMGNAGHQSVFRWQISDNVPFHKSFDGYIEKYGPNSHGIFYACVPVWYLSPGGNDPLGPVPVSERYDYFDWPPEKMAGFLLMEFPRGSARTQKMSRYGSKKWKDDDQLWWTGGRPGDKLNILLPVEKTGAYKVVAIMTKARDYGIVQLYLDEKKVGGPIDLYDPSVIPTEPIDLGKHDLKKGKHKFTIEILGTSEKGVKGHLVGLDEIKLIPAN